MDINEFFKKTFKKTGFNIRPRIFCVDGFNMSVQGSEGHYCTPRMDCEFYYELEVGFTSSHENDLIKYAEGIKDTIKTVCGYVPIQIIENIINKHGGIDVELTFCGNKKIKNFI